MASVDSTEAGAQGEYGKVRASKFRFKPKREREDDERESRRSRKRHKERSSHDTSSRRSHHKKKRKEYHPPLDDDPSRYDDTIEQQYIDPETAFRESLFDALADDEGAAYWEGVYGQPIHTYPNAKPGPSGELEQMTEAEYAEYVRSKMWEKTHEHLIEERRQREENKKRQKEERRTNEESSDWRQDDDRDVFDEKIAASLRRGYERKSQKRWQEAWQHYKYGWDNFAKVLATKGDEDGSLAGKASRGIIPWPVETGRWKDVDKEHVETFFCSAPPADSDWAAALKIERVRWHPDKMQQRFGQNKLDEETVKTITAIFQVVDHLWTENKGRR